MARQSHAADLLSDGRLDPLALVWLHVSGLSVDPYSRHPQRAAHYEPFDSGGAEVSWSITPDKAFIFRRSLSRSHLALQDLEGNILREWRPRLILHSPPGIKLDGTTVAVLAQSSTGEQGIWHYLPDGGIRLVVPLAGNLGQGTPVCWTSEGRNVVTHNHKILLCDPSTGLCSTLANGESPTCSPDGTKIAYTDEQDYVVITAVSDPRRQIFRSPRRAGYGGGIWSQDGSLLFVNEDTKTSSAMVVYRLSDRKRKVLADTEMKSQRWLACLRRSQLPRGK